MPRISGVDLPRDKRVDIGLTYIYGIGRTTAEKICEATGVDPATKVRDLTEEETSRIRDYVEGDLRRETRTNIDRLMAIGCYRGLRHRRGLPVRGQRTHTNARTRKGKRRQIGAKKRG